MDSIFIFIHVSKYYEIWYNIKKYFFFAKYEWIIDFFVAIKQMEPDIKPTGEYWVSTPEIETTSVTIDLGKTVKVIFFSITLFCCFVLHST